MTQLNRTEQILVDWVAKYAGNAATVTNKGIEAKPGFHLQISARPTEWEARNRVKDKWYGWNSEGDEFVTEFKFSQVSAKRELRGIEVRKIHEPKPVDLEDRETYTAWVAGLEADTDTHYSYKADFTILTGKELTYERFEEYKEAEEFLKS